MGLWTVSGQAFAEWANTSELSILNSGGNTNVEVYNLKSATSVKLDRHQLTLSGHYTLGTSDDTVDARNWDISLIDRFALTERWGVYLGEKVEGDRFKGFVARYNSDIGATYRLKDSDKMKSKVELGYRYVVEEKVTGAYAHDNQIRVYGDLDQKLNETVSWTFYAEYLKDVEVGSAWELNFGPALVAALSKTFSLKIGYEADYRNVPAVVGSRKYDYRYTTGLIANF